MKIFCLVLSIGLMLLSTIPCCTDDNCLDEASTEQTGSHEENDPSCSPFLTCGTCSGFVFADGGFIFQAPIAARDKSVIAITPSFTQNCAFKIWQPPKIV